MEGNRTDGTTSPSAALTSPRSLQTPPALDAMGLVVGDSNPIGSGSGVLGAGSGSPKHGPSGTVMCGMGSPVSGLGTPGRSASVSPPGPAMSLVSTSKPYSGSTVSMNGSRLDVNTHLGGGPVRCNGGVPVSLSSYGGGCPRPVHPASPPGIAADISVNDCRLIDYRGAKVAAFYVSGDYLLCLPQAFELFLKHLVGGLHTVYTKLKRLDITPIVCNVEQVRILRGLGAIQPGVNRCKLLSCKDFDSLYKDCTTASSRPGRPPKRVSMVGLSSSASGALLKKSRLENDYHGYENGHISGDRLDKSHLLANGYTHQAALAAANASSSHISPIPFMALNSASHPSSMTPASVPLPLTASSHPHSHNSAMKERQSHGSDVIVSARLREERPELIDGKDRIYGYDSHRIKDPAFRNGPTTNCHSPVLNLSQNSSRGGGGGINAGGGGGDHSGSEAAYNDGQDDEYTEDEDDDKDQDFSDNPDVSSTANGERLYSGQPLLFPHLTSGDNGSPTGQVVSSIETLLRNIQGLLKVAADNARQQERQINIEKAELKMEVLRERELRETVEKQLLEEQRTRILYQKRLKKEKKSRRRFQEQLELEVKKRVQYEEALRSTSADTFRLLNDGATNLMNIHYDQRNTAVIGSTQIQTSERESLVQELERERNSRPEGDKAHDCPLSV